MCSTLCNLFAILSAIAVKFVIYDGLVLCYFMLFFLSKAYLVTNTWCEIYYWLPSILTYAICMWNTSLVILKVNFDTNMQEFCSVLVHHPWFHIVAYLKILSIPLRQQPTRYIRRTSPTISILNNELCLSLSYGNIGRRTILFSSQGWIVE